MRRPSLKVKSVAEGSPAEAMGIRPGDRLLEINDYPIHDLIDYRFYSAEEMIDCLFVKEGEEERICFEELNGQGLGLDFEAVRFRSCGNKCLFCFVDQNPAGMRSALYFKDEDYRLSFLYGNYVTLTRVGKKDLTRIVSQRLSPLYVSIHATDAKVRSFLLGLERDDRLLEKLHFLSQNRIEIHGQVVLCPGFNDGLILRDTVDTLASFYPNL
ncbi:MAG: PDZ domain-containing protein, partial [bacterium]